MSFFARTVVIALIIALVGSVSAVAVGYERYETSRAYRVPSKKRTKTANYHQQSPSILARCPAALDEIAFSVRDILSQFGLVDSRKP
jgi:hypothetical protein